MKIVHITTSNKGGAGIAALRLHESLLMNGVDSKLLSLVQFPSQVKEQYLFKERDCAAFPFFVDLKILTNKVLRKLNLYTSSIEKNQKKHLKNKVEGFERFSFPFSNFNMLKHPLVKSADIIHLHWVSDGFLDYKSFFENCDKRIVWTLHDMNPFTAGCHHADGCIKFETNCHICPQLKGTIDENYSEVLLKIKKEALRDSGSFLMKIVSPSNWLTNLSMGSILFGKFPHYTIPNISNEGIFKLLNRDDARKKLNIPAYKKIILFVAHTVSDSRKGYRFLVEALNRFTNDNSILLCSVGNTDNSNDFKLEHKKMGYVNEEETMADLYAAADVFVLPSMAENFPNTICESLQCGTPVVAFNVGGISELVSSENGRLVVPFDVDKLYTAIDFVLKNQSNFDRASISKTAIELLDKSKATKKYLDLYSELANA